MDIVVMRMDIVVMRMDIDIMRMFPFKHCRKLLENLCSGGSVVEIKNMSHDMDDPFRSAVFENKFQFLKDVEALALTVSR